MGKGLGRAVKNRAKSGSRRLDLGGKSEVTSGSKRFGRATQGNENVASGQGSKRLGRTTQGNENVASGQGSQRLGRGGKSSGSTSTNTENAKTNQNKGKKETVNFSIGKKFWERGQKFNFKGEGKKLNKKQGKAVRKVNAKAKDMVYGHLLSKIDLEGSRGKKLWNAIKSGNSSFMGSMKVKENRVNAGKGIVKSTAFSAAAHGGLAYLQGDDPWEAAKTGAIRGALVGGGYQYAKAATGAKSNLKGFAGIKDNGKQIWSGGKDLLRAHSITGNTEMKENIRNISPQLKRVLEQKQRNEMTGGLFGLKTK